VPQFETRHQWRLARPIRLWTVADIVTALEAWEARQ